MNAGIRQILRANLDAVEERIVQACARARRARSEVTLVAVTKTVTPEIAAHLPELGVFDLGENRPQELWRKAEALPKNILWHFIGHLQRNKIEKTLPLARLIHAVDSVRLLQALDQEAVNQRRQVEVLLEINASGEATKHGFEPDDWPNLLPTLSALRHVQLRGLMTMAAPQEAEACRPTFALLRNLRDQMQAELGSAHRFDQLSMGMSNDFEVAIQEGATFIRLGSVLFEGLPPLVA